jgi:uncharacterized repeat protein (TIGR01451 family)
MGAAATAALLGVGLGAAPGAGAATVGDLVPTLRCVTFDEAEERVRPRFGYVNTTGASLSVDPGADNRLDPPESSGEGQPRAFAAGRVDVAFTPSFVTSEQSFLTWILLGTPVTATQDPTRYCTTDLTLTQSADRATARVGDTITTTLTVRAESDFVEAPAARVTVPLPDGTSLVSAATGAGTCAGTVTVVCTLGPRAPGSTAQVTVAVRADTPGTKLVRGHVAARGAADADASNDTAASSVEVTPAPQAFTVHADDVARTTASLTGVVDPRGQATSYRFQYGTSAAYGAWTPSASVAGGASGAVVRAALTGLTAGTTYHFRLVATNASGQAVGADATFTTSGKATRP